MISKKKHYIILVVAIIISVSASAVGTYFIGGQIGIKTGDQIAVDKEVLQILVENQKRYAKLITLEEFIKENYLEEVTDEQLLEGELKGLFASLGDKYSEYMNAKDFKSYMEDTEGGYAGIGIVVGISKDFEIIIANYTTINGPAERAGIKIGDRILGVDNIEFKANTIEEASKNLEKAVSIMKGESKGKVKLKILGADEKNVVKTRIVEVPREEIKYISAYSEMLSKDVGYIRLVQFDEHIADDFNAHYDKLKAAGMKKLVLDLRNNTGGLVDTSVAIADRLIPKNEKIVYTEERSGRQEYHVSRKDPIKEPYVILVNELTASASEILSGAVKDTKSGVLIGTKTFGKGIVQTIRELKDGSGFKLTISKYFTPNGTSIHLTGIEPNIVVELPENVKNIGPKNLDEDTQLQRAIKELESK